MTRRCAVGRKVGDRGDELAHRRVGGDDAVDLHQLEVARRRRLGRIEDAEDAPSTRVDGLDEADRQPGPAVAHDKDAVLLVERERGVHDDAPNARAAVVDTVAVQVLDPALG